MPLLDGLLSLLGSQMGLQDNKMLEMEELLNYVPHNWTKVNYVRDYELVELPKNDLPYMIKDLQMSGPFNLGTTKIVRVQNPFLYSQFLIKKEEYVHRGLNPRVLTLFHDTGESNIPSIVSSNLDWRKAKRTKFGKGVSFSSCPKYANRQSSRKNGSRRAMIFADVLVANCEDGFYSTKIPHDGYDTTIGNCEKVYVKYYDDEFYPSYVAYYNSAPVIENAVPTKITFRKKRGKTTKQNNISFI